MKVKDLIFVLEKLNPELEVHYDLGRDTDPIDKITAGSDRVMLNSKSVE